MPTPLAVRYRNAYPVNHAGVPGAPPIVVSAQVNPIRLAWKFARRRRMQRLLANRSLAVCSIATLVLLGAPTAFAAWRQLRLHGALALSPLRAHPIAAAIVAVAFAWAASMRSRRRAERQFVQSWLACAPIGEHDRLAALRWRVGFEVIAPAAAVIAALVCVRLASGVPVAGLLVAIVAGFAAGMIAGWHAGARPHGRADALPRLRRSRAATSIAASLAPLRRWPFAQLRAAANPRIEARLVGALLLALPMTIPPRIVLLMLAFGLNALAAFSLLRASLATIPAAADWLRATPLGLGALAHASCQRAGICQIGFAVFGGLLALALGASANAAGLLAATWLGVGVTATASALACRHRPERLVIELACIGTLLLAIASVEPAGLAWGLPAVWLWQAIRMRNA